MKIFKDEILGEYNWANVFWIRDYHLLFFGVYSNVKLILDAEEGDDLDDLKKAFSFFEQNSEEELKEIENAIVNYYNNVEDEELELLKAKSSVHQHIKLNNIVLDCLDEGIGFLLECDWDKEHGFGVRWQRGRIRVGCREDLLL